MHNRRHIDRRQLMQYLRVYEYNTAALLGYVVDISMDGFMLLSEVPLETGKTMRVRIVLNEKERKEMVFTVESLWSAKDINPNYVNTGFRLLEIPPKEFDSVRDILEKHCYQSLA